MTKTVHTRINETSDVYIYQNEGDGYTCITRAKYKSQALSNASASMLLGFLMRPRGSNTLLVPSMFMDKLSEEVRAQRLFDENFQ